jgi:RHS repeat-associated protein
MTLIRNPQNDRTTYQYDNADRRTGILRHSVNNTTISYDKASQITTMLHHSPGGVIATFAYGYDNAGTRTSVVESGATVTWGYDNAYRLTSEVRQNTGGAVLYRDTFTYDAAGNRTLLHNAAGRTTYTYDAANQLETAVLGATRTTYTYDYNGNLEVENAAGTRTTHTWNDENQLTQVQKTGMTTNQYTFNGDGQRVQIVDSQGTKKPIWDLENILLETDGSNVMQVVYTLEPNLYGNLVSQRRGSTTSYYLFDALGSTRKLTNSAGSITDSYDFHAYGETYASSGSTVNVCRWVGQLGYYFDIDRLAYYLRARPYNPGIARFLSQDPIGLWATQGNQYDYSLSNPIKFTDPAGLWRPAPPRADREYQICRAACLAGFGVCMLSALVASVRCLKRCADLCKFFPNPWCMPLCVGLGCGTLIVIGCVSCSFAADKCLQQCEEDLKERLNKIRPGPNPPPRPPIA